MDSFDAIIIGAGAAGMMAAITACQNKRRVLLIEKNRKVGVKILMSGGTRCNLTHNESPRQILQPFGRRQANFLKTAVGRFPPGELIDWFAAAGVPTKVEDTDKVFPKSDKALDVQLALLQEMEHAGVVLANETAVESVQRNPSQDGFIITAGGTEFGCDKLLITTGGVSYPGCGTVGDGYSWARQFGHRIVQPVPALVPLLAESSWLTELSGVSLDHVRLLARAEPTREFDEVCFKSDQPLLFTHFGLSGPGAMNISKVFAAANNTSGQLRCDFLPDINDDQLRGRLEATGDPTSVLNQWLPRRLSESLCEQVGFLGGKGNQLSKKQRQQLVDAVKRNAVAISGTRGFKKAEVTAGGVALEEIQPQTMESRLVPGLYFAGEVLDVDGPIGGYNFQAAFSTGRLAGNQI